MNNIYLCGFLGCGKGEIGKRLAKFTGRRFLDLDAFLSKKAGRKIEDILNAYGEEKFRTIENSFMTEISKMDMAVIAVGDGTFAYEDNIMLAKNSGEIVYLYLPFELCYKRIKRGRHFSLNSANAQEKLLKIYNRRHTVYKISSTLTFEIKNSPERSARELAQLLSV